MSKMTIKLRVCMGLLVSLSVGCSADAGGAFSAKTERIVLEVDYQTGAQPYDKSMRTYDAWDLFEANAKALFAEHEPELQVPHEPSAMQELSDVTAHEFSVSDILAIADTHRDEDDTDTQRSFYALFLDGYFADQGKRETGVLGVSIGDTGVIAMFKPVISSAASPRVAQATLVFVEQSTLIHEFGHAVGLVDNGLPMVTAHSDAEHGAHCDNPDCVMYYLNEGVSDLVGFVKNYVKSADTVLFDDNCLQDAHAAEED
jgi:hypothetical protein